MNDELALMDYLLKFPPYVLEGLQIDPVPGKLLHISPNPTIPTFIPRQIKRTMPGEDEYVPRVCTGVGLLDCLRGYAVSVSDFLSKTANCAGNDDWLGGYTIYEIPHNGCLVPDARMAPISKWCEERWLVSYKCDNQEYPGNAIGKLFINAVGLTKEKRVITEIYLVVQQGPMIFDRHLTLGPGYWKITVPSLESYSKGAFSRQEVEVEKLDPSVFIEAKGSKASLLSYELSSTIFRW